MRDKQYEYTRLQREILTHDRKWQRFVITERKRLGINK